jgi:hypothetical protein
LQTIAAKAPTILFPSPRDKARIAVELEQIERAMNRIGSARWPRIKSKTARPFLSQTMASPSIKQDQHPKSRVGVVLARAQKERAPAICRGPEAEVFSGQWAV